MSDASADGASDIREEQPAPGWWTLEGLVDRLPAERGDQWLRLSGRLALGIFLAYLVYALLRLLDHGAAYWFAGDDWGLLARSDVGDVGELLTPQNNHWSTVPIIIYAVLFRIVGLHSYTPYQAVAIVLHLTSAFLLRLVMRRAGVGPWMATITASTFVLYGTANQNLFQSIQIGWQASMVAGLGYLLLVDHDGPIGKRDWAGLGAGVLSLMSSGLGPVTVAIVGGVALVRRGSRAFLFHVGPLVGLYLIWSQSQSEHFVASPANYSISTMIEWSLTGIVRNAQAFAQDDVVAVCLAGLVAVGLAVAWIPLSWSDFRRRAAAPLVLFLAQFAFFAAVASQRWPFGDAVIAQSRYMGIAAALALPALGVAASALVERFWPIVFVVVPLIAWGFPPNVDLLDAGGRGEAFYAQQREFVLAAAHHPLADQVRDGVHPDPRQFRTDEVTTGWLVEAREAGRLPEQSRIPAQLEKVLDVRLRLSQDIGPQPIGASCQSYDDPVDTVLDEGTVLSFQRQVRVTLLDGDGEAVGVSVVYNTIWSGALLRAEVPDLRVRFEANPPTGVLVLCGLE